MDLLFYHEIYHVPQKFKAGEIKRHSYQDTLWANADKKKTLKQSSERKIQITHKGKIDLWYTYQQQQWMPEGSGTIFSKCREKIIDRLAFYSH